MKTRLRHWLRYQRYRKEHGHLVWLVGPRADAPRSIVVFHPALAHNGRHLPRPRFFNDDSLLASMSSPA